jgi:methionyl-tRNA synthetase
MPWALAKEEDKQDRLATVLYNLVESIVIGATLLEPFMPETSEKICAQLNAPKRKVNDLVRFGGYKSGTKVTDSPEILFARLDVEEVLKKVEEMMPEPEPEPEPVDENPGIDIDNIKPEITIDDFDKIQLRVGEVIACEEVKNSKKLLCSKVKIGSEVRQIVSGIKSDFSPEDMVGKKVVVITNLAPAKLAGVLSEGMLLCAEDDEGNLALLTAERDVPAGSMIS